MATTDKLCMWCQEELSEEERLRPIQGHYECSAHAVLDAETGRATTFVASGVRPRDAARLTVLEMLRHGEAVEVIHNMSEDRRKRFRPSNYDTLPAERRVEIDSLLGIYAVSP